MTEESVSKVKYIHSDNIHNLIAPGQIVPFLIDKFKPQSVVDVGCGLGTFLAIFKQNGITNVKGIDGCWVDKSKLFIDESDFMERNLEKRIQFDIKFDMVLCLEVAEHLVEKSSNILVENLVSLGNIIVFSAAVPNQGGQNHINEQDFEYWQKKFENYGFKFYDIFRTKFWKNAEIDWWYRQNMFLVAHESILFDESIRKFEIEGFANVYIHPELLKILKNYINEGIANQKVNNGEYPLRVYFGGIWRKTLRFFKGSKK